MRLVVNLLFTLVSFLVLGLFPAVRTGGASLPVITLQPTNVTVPAGAGTALRVFATGDPTPAYQWYFEQAAVSGATFSILSVVNASTPKQGSYFAVVSNTVGMVTSDVAVVTVVTSAPAILSQPSNIVATVGQNVTISIIATGLPFPSYTWWFNETNRLNSASPRFTQTAAGETNSGIYTVVLSNSVAAITSAPIALTVSPLPLLTLQPTNQNLIETDLLTMHVAAIGSLPIYYQWFFENAPIAGATATNFAIASVSLTNSGSYYCVVSNYGGQATSEVATVTVSPVPTHPGALDIFYKPNTNGWNVSDLIVLEDDKLLAAGDLTQAGLRRLNVDGTIDSTFAGPNLPAAKIALQPDGKTVVVSGSQLYRFDRSGLRDTNFAPAAIDLPNPVHDVGVQPDGGIVYVGRDLFAPVNSLGRFLPDGTQDRFFRTFEPIVVEGGVEQTGGEIKTVEVLPNGAFLFPGPAVVRRHSNGALDSSFAIATTSAEGQRITSI